MRPGMLLALQLTLLAWAFGRGLADDNAPRALPDFSLYHARDVLLQEVLDVVDGHPDFLKAEKLQASNGGYSATVMVVTAEPGGFTENHENKIRVLLDFGEHARELITCEVGLRFLRTLADRAAFTDLLRDGGESVDQVLRRTVFKILPMENYNGRKRVEEGSLCERRNGRGIDPNRNWAVDWGVKEKDYDPQEEDPGTGPFSEPETQIVYTVARDFAPHVWVNVHSGMQALFMPYDHIGTLPTGEGAEIQLKILKTLQEKYCEGQCAVGPGGKTVGYLAHGTATDYMYTKLNVSLPFTFEIYGDESANNDDCIKMFNPLDKDSYEKIVRKWVIILFRLVGLLPLHPDMPDSNVAVAADSTVSKGPPGGVNGGAGAPFQISSSLFGGWFTARDGFGQGPTSMQIMPRGQPGSAAQHLAMVVAMVMATLAIGCYVIKRRRGASTRVAGRSD
eukprot:evm.model.scf_1286.5 EVM.evm.TU.scf_1286.5   scf_1286:26366-34697(-)